MAKIGVTCVLYMPRNQNLMGKLGMHRNPRSYVLQLFSKFTK
jgi:hypothetical protein